jgi:dUTP pyrophosphatase
MNQEQEQFKQSIMGDFESKPNEEVYIKFLKTRKVKSPTRGSYLGNAGIDLYMPEDLTREQLREANEKVKGKIVTIGTVGNEKCISVMSSIIIPPHVQVIIPSGIKAIIKPTNSMLQVNNKSGVSTKKGLLFTAQVIDSNYTGEIHIAVINASNELVTIEAGEKLIQLVHIPVYPTVPEEIDQDEFEALENTEKSTYGKGERRGDKWQGSDKK